MPKPVTPRSVKTRLGKMHSVESLEDALSEPTPCAIAALRDLPGDLLILGAGGKMGLSLARMAQRASELAGVRRRILAVSRFTETGKRRQFEQYGLETRACDLLERRQVSRLPVLDNVIFMTGMKFGSAHETARTWAMNCLVPAYVGERFASSRIVAFSTGNVYPLTPVARGGSRETDRPDPVSEYGMSCLGRERMFEYFSIRNGTPLALLRLNYACELRYGVLVDLAEQVWQGIPVDLSMGYVNVIWQGDANAQALAALGCASAPATVLNLAGPETLAVRDLADEFGRLFGKGVRFRGRPGPDALLSCSAQACELFGPPRVTVPQLQQAIADWISRGGARLGKPTKFQARDGRF